MGGIAQKAHEERAGCSSHNGGAHYAGKAAMVFGYGVQSQGEDDWVHKAHCKTYGRERVESNASAIYCKGCGQKGCGKDSTDSQENLGVYELEQQKAYDAAYEHTAPEPGYGTGSLCVRINSVITLQEEADVVGNTLLCANVEEDSQCKQPYFPFLEQLKV